MIYGPKDKPDEDNAPLDIEDFDDSFDDDNLEDEDNQEDEDWD